MDSVWSMVLGSPDEVWKPFLQLLYMACSDRLFRYEADVGLPLFPRKGGKMFAYLLHRAQWSNVPLVITQGFLGRVVLTDYSCTCSWVI